MTINQLSVFIENKAGTLLRVLKLLKEARIQIISSTIADTVDYGICRIICSDSDKAYHILKDAGLSVALSDVFALQLDNEPGCAADAVEILSNEGIGITYLYSFLLGGHGILIFRTDNAVKTRETIIANSMRSLTEKDITALSK